MRCRVFASEAKLKFIKPPVLNMPGLRIWQVDEYNLRVTQDAKYR